MLALVPLREDEFTAFFETVVASHASDNIAAGRWTASEAVTRAREETSRLLPRREKTSESHLFVLGLAPSNTEVGYLWFGSMTRAGKKVAYLYQLYIHPALRRQGYGRQALAAFENEAATRGYDSVGLHVFATNASAHRLYQSVGYSASSITMHKLLRSDA